MQCSKNLEEAWKPKQLNAIALETINFKILVPKIQFQLLVLLLSDVQRIFHVCNTARQIRRNLKNDLFTFLCLFVCTLVLF